MQGLRFRASSPPQVDRILGLYWGYNNGQENGNYYLGFRVSGIVPL